jgi:PBP1b-binding outer membrane lipoprotein LpoB
MFSSVRASSALVLATLLLAGCASEGGGFSNPFTTGSVANTDTPQATAAPRVDPQCVALVSRIETLRKDGISEKIEKAAAKKYKMTAADAAKADQLNKANADFQARCSTITPPNVSAQGPAPRPATN